MTFNQFALLLCYNVEVINSIIIKKFIASIKKNSHERNSIFIANFLNFFSLVDELLRVLHLLKKYECFFEHFSNFFKNRG